MHGSQRDRPMSSSGYVFVPKSVSELLWGLPKEKWGFSLASEGELQLLLE